MDNICVAIRVRPINQREANQQQQTDKSPWIFDTNSIAQLSLATGKPLGTYTFDYIYNSDVPTKSLYDGVAKDIIKSAVDGINGTIFAYGQTSSGKTFTMMGSDDTPGITPLGIRDIFSHIEACPNREFLLRVSYMEIYNEKIQDLLSNESKELKIHVDMGKGIYVGGIKEDIVVSADQVLKLMKSGEERRHIGSTNMNEHSSRSHTIFRLVIESRERSAGGERKSMDGAVKVSMLNLVDLAGSERIAHTGAEGIRQKEGSHINKSLLALSTVIAKLSEGQKQLHIPYRDSKLTHILQTALGGNARTAIICTVTPAAVHQEETLSTIKFATRAKNIKNKPIINEVMNEATMLRKYKGEIDALKKQLAERQEVIEQKVEDSSAKENELETLRSQLDTLKGVIIHSSLPSQPSETSRRPKRSSRRETWCPGEAGALPGIAGMGGMVPGMHSGGDVEIDIKAELDMDLGFSYKSSEAFPPRKRQHSTESPIPISMESSFSSDQHTPKLARHNSTTPLPSFQRAELLLSAKKEKPLAVQDSAEVAELRKEVQRLKTAQSEVQSTVEILTRERNAQQQAADQTRAENDAIRKELEEMVSVAKSSYTELEHARALIDELQENTTDGWAEERAALERELSEIQQQADKYKGVAEKYERESEVTREQISSLRQETDVLDDLLSESAAEVDAWKTKFNDLRTEFDLAQANWMEREEELIAQQEEPQVGCGAETQAGTTNEDQAALLEERRSWEERFSALTSQLTELTELFNEKDRTLETLRQEHEQAVEAWKAQQLELHYEYDTYCEDAEQEQERLNNIIEDMRLQLQNKDDEVDKLASQLDEIANKSILPDTDSSELRAMLDETRKECERLSGLLNEAEEALEASSSQHSTLVQTMEEDKAQAADRVDTLSKECERLTNLLTETEKALSEGEKELERVNQLATSTHVLQRERDQLALCAADLKEQVRTLQQRLETTMVAECNMQTEAKKVGEVLQSQLDAARHEISSLSEQLLKAQHETATQVATHVARCQNVEASLRAVTEKLDHQAASQESLQQRTKAAESEAQKHLEALRALEGNATHASKKAQQYQTSADLSRQQCDSLSSKLAELTKENQKLEGKLSEADRYSRERIELLESSAKLKSELSQTNAAYERQREELSKVQQQCKRVQEALDEASHNHAATKNMAAASEEKANQTLAEIQVVRRELEEREGVHRRERVVHDTQLEAKEAELQRVISELAKNQEESSEYHSQMAVLRRDLGQLAVAAKDYDRLATELSQTKTRYATEAAQWKEENLKLKKELRSFSSTNSSAEKERDATGREMEKLKQKYENLDLKYKQAAQTNISLESDKVTADRETKQLRKQNADLERTNEKLKTTDNKSKETQATLAQVTKTYEQLVKTHETLTKASDKLRLDFEAKSSDLTREIEAKVKLEVLLSDSHLELEAKATCIDNLSREKAEEINKKKELDQVLLATTGRLDEITCRLNEVDAQLQTTTAELTAARKDKEIAEEEKEKLCIQLTEMHYTVEERSAELSAKQFEFTKDLTALTSELDSAKETLLQRETTLEEKSVALLTAASELEALKLEASKLQEDLTKAVGELDVSKEELESTREELSKAQQDLLRTATEFSTSAGLDKDLLVKASTELSQVKEELSATCEALTSSKAEVSGLLVRVEETELELNVTKDWVQEQASSVQRLEQDKAQLSEKLVQFKRLYDEKVQHLSEELASRTAEIKMWHGRTEVLGAVEKKLQETEEENRLCQGKVAELQGLVEAMEEEAKATRREYNLLCKQGAQMGNTEFESQLAALRLAAEERENELLTENEDIARKLETMLDEAVAAEAIRDSQFKYQKKIKELLEKLAKAETATKRANESCSQKETELEALRREIEQLKVDVNDDGTLTKQDLISEITRLEGVVADLKSELEASKRVAEKAENVRKAKLEFDSLYQDRRKGVNATPKTPLTECTNRTPLSLQKENF